MKKLLFILLFIPFFSKSQSTVPGTGNYKYWTLPSTNTAGLPGTPGLYMLWNTDSTEIAVYDGTNWRYLTYNNSVIPVLRESVAISSAGTLTLSNFVNYIFTGSTTTWTLPTASATRFYRYKIKNEGSGNITINAAGSDHIYSTSSVTNITVAPGATVMLYNQDGSIWAQE